MVTWVLILTLMGGFGSSISATPGFTSLEACQAAGAVWKNDIESNHKAGSIQRFVCVSTAK